MRLRSILIAIAFLVCSLAFGESSRSFRLTAPERAVQMRVEVLYSGGTPLYDSDWKSGNLLDIDALPYGTYQLRIQSRDVEGKTTERLTTLNIAPERTTIDPALPDDLKLTLTAHDGTTGQIITTSGDLSFRFGDYLNKKDTEAMRLSPEGNLEVKGWIKAGQGLMLPDGTTVDTQKKLKAKANATGAGTMNQISKWIDSAGTLGDSSVSEVGGADRAFRLPGPDTPQCRSSLRAHLQHCDARYLHDVSGHPCTILGDVGTSRGHSVRNSFSADRRHSAGRARRAALRANRRRVRRGLHGIHLRTLFHRVVLRCRRPHRRFARESARPRC